MVFSHSSLPFLFFFASLSFLLIPETAYSLLISIIATGSQEIGSTYTLQCKVTSVNIPTIIWKNSTDIISNSSAGIEVGSLVNNGDIWSVTLTLGPLHQSHDGEYMCIASDTSNQTVTVDVISESLYTCLLPIMIHMYLPLFIYPDSSSSSSTTS